MAAAATAIQIPINLSPPPACRRSNATAVKAMIPRCKISPGVSILFPAATLSCRSLPIRASKSEIDQVDDSDTAFTVKQDDVSYLLKLGAGSLLGAAAIKYGSALFPEITIPNILQALVMIFGPVIVSVLLLIKKSSVE